MPISQDYAHFLSSFNSDKSPVHGGNMRHRATSCGGQLWLISPP